MEQKGAFLDIFLPCSLASLLPMAISLRNGLCFSGYSEVGKERKAKRVGEVEGLVWKNEFRGQNVLKEQSGAAGWTNPKGHSNSSIHVSSSLLCLFQVSEMLLF